MKKRLSKSGREGEREREEMGEERDDYGFTTISKTPFLNKLLEFASKTLPLLS